MKHHIYSVKFHDVKHQIKTINIYASSFDRAFEEAKIQLEIINQTTDRYQLYSIEKTQMVLYIASEKDCDDSVTKAAQRLQSIADSML